jgi:hypothetical protein
VILKGTEHQTVAPLKPGSYLFSVAPAFSEGPTGTFALSKASKDREASVSKLTSAPGNEGNGQVELTWPSNGGLLLRKTDELYDGTYVVTVNIANLLPATFHGSRRDEAVESDLVTKEYLQEQVSLLQVGRPGINIKLTGTSFTKVTSLSAGSYLITVSPQMQNGSAATFAISKSGNAEPSMTRMTSASSDSGECLELSWQGETSDLCLRKTGAANDGLYSVTFNSSEAHARSSPCCHSSLSENEKTLDEAAVAVLVQQSLTKLGYGVQPSVRRVILQGTLAVQGAVLRPGSYVVSVSCLVQGGPAATYTLSKVANQMTASIVRLTSCRGDDGETEIEMLWPETEGLILRKTTPRYDGPYALDLHSPRLEEVGNEQGMQQIADKPCDDSVTFRLEDTTTTDIKGVPKGSRILHINPISGTTGPGATFAVTKITDSVAGHVMRISSLPSMTGEELEIQWPQDGPIQIRKTGSMCDGEYELTTNGGKTHDPSHEHTSPVEEKSEATTHDNEVKHHAPVVVRLQGTNPSVCQTPLRGSFTVHVTPAASGPSACFIMSRSSPQRAPSSCKVTSTAGEDDMQADSDGTVLELTWPQHGTMMLRKTSPRFDGDYKVRLL